MKHTPPAAAAGPSAATAAGAAAAYAAAGAPFAAAAAAQTTDADDGGAGAGPGSGRMRARVRRTTPDAPRRRWTTSQTPRSGPPASVEQPAMTVVVSDLDELTAKAEKADEYLALAQRVRRTSRTTASALRVRRRRRRSGASHSSRRSCCRRSTTSTGRSRPRRRWRWHAGDGEQATDSQLVSGIRLVHADVLAALARVGIQQFSPEGEPFDPTLHEAVAQAPIEGAPPGTVVEVYQRGYRIGESVLRPARVLVAA